MEDLAFFEKLLELVTKTDPKYFQDQVDRQVKKEIINQKINPSHVNMDLFFKSLGGHVVEEQISKIIHNKD